MEYRVEYKGNEFNIIQNEDGTFNIPEEIRDLEPFGTALKPASEYIVLARKPLSEKSVAENVLKWRTGGINVDGCRVGSDIISTHSNGKGNTGDNGIYGKYENIKGGDEREGRFPANLILECSCTLEDKSSSSICDNREGSESHTNPMCPCRLLDEQSGTLKSGKYQPHHKRGKTLGEYQGSCYGKYNNQEQMLDPDKTYGDSGGASRFFYQAKVSKAERNMGLDGFEGKKLHNINQLDDRLRQDGTLRETPIHKNNHPTVKPINLMTYLCRLITPEGGIVLDPFMGSGSTGIAAQLEGFRFVGMEMDEDYFKIAEARINNYEKYKKFLK